MPSLPPATLLSLAAPAYNEGASIGEVVEGWVEYLRASSRPFEVVICNDGSRDDTGEVLDALAARIPELVVVHHRVNQGAGAALASAIRRTGGAWVLLLDSDGQFPIENLERLLGAVQQRRAHGAIGVRPEKKDGFVARFGTWSSGALCNLFHGTAYRDFNSALKLLPGEVLRSFLIEGRGLNYSTEITARCIEHRMRLAEVDIEHRPRVKGTSSMRLVRGSVHRLLFVLYLGGRRLLQQWQVLSTPVPVGEWFEP